jgi:hypothetical protein
VVGELIWALTPLQAEQIDAVIAFTQGLQHTHTRSAEGHLHTRSDIEI